MNEFIEACENGNIKKVKELINQVDLEHRITGSDTALFKAYMSRNYEIAELLINNGANINYQNKHGVTLLMMSSFSDGPLLDLLIEKGAKLDTQDTKGDTALIRSAFAPNGNSASRLIKAGANLNIVNNRGDTALMVASGDNNLACVDVLIKNGADISIKNLVDMTAFEIAVESQYIKIAYLIDKNIIHNEDELFRACHELSEENVLFFYEKDANFYLENEKGKSAFKILNKKKNLPPALQALKEKLIFDTYQYEISEDSLGL